MHARNILTRLAAILMSFCSSFALAEVSRIEISSREILRRDGTSVQYEAIRGVLHYTLDPLDSGNDKIADIGHAPRNNVGLVEFSTDFKLLVPRTGVISDTLLYNVNNRGRSSLPPEISLSHPLSALGYTYLVTGWINELEEGDERFRLHAPVVGSASSPITGQVRYEIIVNSPAGDANIAGSGHLAYPPVTDALRTATLTRRVNQDDAREVIARENFNLLVSEVENSNQPRITLSVTPELEPGVLYELIYEARNPVLSGAGLAGIRDAVALLRHGTQDNAVTAQLTDLQLPALTHTVAWGNSQSGRLLRQFLYQGFNEDLDGQRVFDGVIPVIAGAGFGMFNTRFAMPTSTNGQHEYHLFPNDYFPFTYGNSVDPLSGRSDGILKQARESGTEPKLMHIQTSNEYWIRAGSLPHTDPLGRQDAQIPENVRFYTIGGSQHGSGSGKPGTATLGQLPGNPNMWSPFADSLLVKMVEWVRDDTQPPGSRYPRIADGSLVPSHLANGSINPDAWHVITGISHPKAMYKVGQVDFGTRFRDEGVLEQHTLSVSSWYEPLVPRVNVDNNDSPESTLLPPMTAVPLGTFVPWNLRSLASGAPSELARLTGGYIAFSATSAAAATGQDQRASVQERYASFEDYLQRYEAVTDTLIAQGYLLPAFKDTLMSIARDKQALLP